MLVALWVKENESVRGRRREKRKEDGERERRGRRMEKRERVERKEDGERESGEEGGWRERESGEEGGWRRERVERRRMEEDGEEEESTIRSVYSVQTKSESSAYVYKAGVDIICSFHSSWP